MTNLNKTLGLVLVSGLISLTSCDKQDDTLIDIPGVETTVVKDIDNTFPSSISSKNIASLNQSQLMVQYEQALVAIDYLQSQDDFFTNGSITSAIIYIESRLDLLNKTNTFTPDAIQQFASNLEYIAGVVENNIELYRATILGGNVDTIIEDMEKQADEAPFRIYQDVSADMNGTVVTLDGIEWVKVSETRYEFVVFGENVELLPEAKHTADVTLIFKDNKVANGAWKLPNYIVKPINAKSMNATITTEFVGATETFSVSL